MMIFSRGSIHPRLDLDTFILPESTHWRKLGIRPLNMGHGTTPLALVTSYLTLFVRQPYIISPSCTKIQHSTRYPAF